MSDVISSCAHIEFCCIHRIALVFCTGQYIGFNKNKKHAVEWIIWVGKVSRKRQSLQTSGLRLVAPDQTQKQNCFRIKQIECSYIACKFKYDKRIKGHCSFILRDVLRQNSPKQLHLDQICLAEGKKSVSPRRVFKQKATPPCVSDDHNGLLLGLCYGLFDSKSVKTA